MTHSLSHQGFILTVEHPLVHTQQPGGVEEDWSRSVDTAPIKRTGNRPAGGFSSVQTFQLQITLTRFLYIYVFELKTLLTSICGKTIKSVSDCQYTVKKNKLVKLKIISNLAA